MIMIIIADKSFSFSQLLFQANLTINYKLAAVFGIPGLVYQYHQ
jgi:hypothetical protein